VPETTEKPTPIDMPPSASPQPGPTSVKAACTALISRLSQGERVPRLASPKLRAKAPITALIAPLAPIIGTVEAGSANHCAPAAA